MPLHAIAYVSTSRERQAPPDEVDKLLADARDFNGSCGVTGVLIWNDGTFFQYIEGSTEAVQLVYARIVKSSAHHGIIELFNDSVEKRHFSTWSMGFAEATKTDIQRISQATWVDQLNNIKDQAESSPGLILLLSFWKHRNGGRA